MDNKEKKRQSKIFIWAIIVVLVNLIQYFFHNPLTIGIALVVTVFALYVITIKDNVEPNQTKNKTKNDKTK